LLNLETLETLVHGLAQKRSALQVARAATCGKALIVLPAPPPMRVRAGLAAGSPSFPIDNSFNRFAELRTSRRWRDASVSRAPLSLDSGPVVNRPGAARARAASRAAEAARGPARICRRLKRPACPAPRRQWRMAVVGPLGHEPRLRALTGQERNSSRSRRTRDVHRFESPQLHQEVAANRPGS
jgi:hypothetical protein